MKLVLIRHGKTNWSDRFTGWRDESHVTLEGLAETLHYSKKLKSANFQFDYCFTSRLHRAIKTALVVLEELDNLWIPHEKAWQLNERHYGALQGMNKKEAVAKFGSEQVEIWRRGYDVAPPLLDQNDTTHPRFDPKYADVDPNVLPSGECLLDVSKRTLPYFHSRIMPLLMQNKTVLISGNHNAMRSIVMEIEKLSSEQVAQLNLPYSIPLIYQFASDGKINEKKFLATDTEIQSQVQDIKNQTKG